MRADYILDLSHGQVSEESYKYFASALKFYIRKYNWPKHILDESNSSKGYWTEEEILSFTNQFLLFIIEKKKLKNISKTPRNYIEYYFKAIIVSYVANRIKEHQNKLGLSFDDTKRVSLEILNDLYFSKKIKNDVFWNKENVFVNPVLNNETINDILDTLPKIPITERTKRYKPRVKTALNDVFSKINRPIKQNVIFNQVFKLFDQSKFLNDTHNKENCHDIRKDEAHRAIERIMKEIEQRDIHMFMDYFFSDEKVSMTEISHRFKTPKSTVHFKLNTFKKKIASFFQPNNETEGLFFIEELHRKLDKMK